MSSNLPINITWLLPVKNGMPFLRQTLASIEAQTHQGARIIAWDNGSTDSSVEELNSWIPQRIVGSVVVDQPLSLGLSLAAMVKLAETEYCARIDADDIALPHRLELQISKMLEDPQIGVCGCNHSLIDEEGETISGEAKYPTEDAEIRWRVRFANTMVHPSVVFKRSLVLEVGNYRDIIPGQDIDLWMRLANKTRFANLGAQLICCRRHPGRVGTTYKKSGVETHRELAQKNADLLFPGTDGEDALRLHEILSADLEADVTAADISLHEKAAQRLGEELEGDLSYFTNSSYYKWQRRNLRSRYINGLGPIKTIRRLLPR